MIKFLAKRIASSVLVLIVVTFLLYVLTDLAIDPLQELRTSTSPNKEADMAARTQQLHLDVPSPLRYLWWLGGVGGCFIGRCNLGSSWKTHQTVLDMLPGAVGTSLKLVFAATIVAILIGVVVGLISALRQYTTFDYVITFVTFLMYSLPVFWVAVLLKQYGSISFNNYLQHPRPNWPLIIVISIAAGLFWMGAMAGSLRRRLINLAAATVITFAALTYVFTSGWLQHPGLGLVGSLVIALGAAVLVTHLSTGLNNRRSLYAALTTAVVMGGAVYYGMQWFYHFYNPTVWLIALLTILAIAVGVGIGLAFGGPDKWQSARTAGIVALIAGVVIFIDQAMQYWAKYSKMSQISGRPIRTIGAGEPGLEGNFWIHTVDNYTHLILPSIALILISFATYTRYTRGSMLEVMNQDYIRTARAKGLSERTVIMRHAMRNALLPLAAVVPVDLMTIIGGAVMTETVFGWSGMGKMFADGLHQADIDPIMAYILIVGILSILANVVADFVYGILDPRIRVTA
ncbi:ABC transporter permease subunit [Brevibacterium sp. 5221]|uniref:ABC transporter permease subunit n=1 Tax=Brevibacterium rongguiense TaxID=2695267 RepID=A0A6N9H7J5_9MICO|nr:MULTISPECIES: ABC transporter permease [Brevibacterium]MYM19746.1 ABC transporter permease subunit [Brevibacterium rongguiense]WAL40467.1 ABC transporter permease [Brevibacterium sp. BRM-1]